MKSKKLSDTRIQFQGIGKEIRALRLAHGLNLAGLAELTGFSVSFLSKVERNVARPSVTALQEIAAALDVQVGWFFATDGSANGVERPYIVRARNRRRLTYSGVGSTDYLGFEDYLLSAGLDGALALGMSRYAPGGTTGDDLYTHDGEEAGLLLEGEIELHLDGQVFRLLPGDSFSFPSHLPHKFTNPGENDAVVVWANTPVSLRRKRTSGKV